MEACAFGMGLTRGFFYSFTTYNISVVKNIHRTFPQLRGTPGKRALA
jgi:hypothetical protein